MRPLAQSYCWCLMLAGLLASSPTAYSATPAKSSQTFSLANFRQLPTVILAPDDPSLPQDLRDGRSPGVTTRGIPGRRLPPVASLAELTQPGLSSRTVPLPEANTLAHVNYQACRFGRAQTAAGETRWFNPECILVKFKGQPFVSALGTESGQELETVRVLASRPEVEFAELDVLQRRAFVPNDPLLGNQWHHQKIGSYAAWDKSLGRSSIHIAIVDAPFQMDHPDLAPHTLPGWDVVANQPVTSCSGIHHSTFSAGMAAAVIGNGLGVAGAGNCSLLPININGFISEMCNAVYWAATNGVRVVNISWTGADSDAVNAAGAYLRLNAHGILAMPGLNGTGFVDYPNQPDIWCVSMTDAADNPQSAYGYHIDFAAPGWQVYSTTVSGGYTFDSGTSYATPLFCGVVAVLFSINPTLGSEDVINLLKSTALDKGPTGWDMWYGWGRINFGAAAAAATTTLPRLSGVLQSNGQFCVATSFKPGLDYTLWRTPAPAGGPWTPVTNAVLSTNNGQIFLTDPSPASGTRFYRVTLALP